ncbi:MAG: hypothetical protein ACRCXT_19215 [Paraclostridium sp.]
MIEPIINSFNVKYDILNDEVQRNLKSGSEITLFINVDSVLSYCYTKIFKDYINRMGKIDYYLITPLLVNVAAHYRHYFASRYRVKSKIVFYKGNGVSVNSQSYYPEYNMTKLNTLNSEVFLEVSKFVNDNMVLFDNICKYIQDVYFINIPNIESSLIPHHIMKKDNNNNMIYLTITRDTNDFQLVNSHDNSFVMYVSKGKTRMINKFDVYEYMLFISGGKYELQEKIDSNFMSYILSYSGLKSRNIKGIKGSGLVSVLKRVTDKIKNGHLMNTKIKDIKLLNSIMGLNDNIQDIVTNNFNSLDLDYQYSLLDNFKRDMIDEMMKVNIHSNEDIMYINEHYFKCFEINLLYLEEMISR